VAPDALKNSALLGGCRGPAQEGRGPGIFTYRQRATTIQLYGRLGRAPEQRTTRTGKAMVTGAMVVDLGRDVEMPEWFGLVAFGPIGEALAKHGTGDMAAISDRLTKSAWKARDGAERAGFSVCVDGIASARTVRPGKPKAWPREINGNAVTNKPAVPFDDELRF
jgi:single-stranded DNA-binding protein